MTPRRTGLWRTNPLECIFDKDPVNTEDWLESVGLRALSSRETVRASYDIARLAIARSIPGEFVECGVFAGVQSAAMAYAIEQDMNAQGFPVVWECVTGKRAFRKVHLFDSFEGIPEPGEFDAQFQASGLKRGTSACTMAQVQGHMAEWGIAPELLAYHPGWFHNTIPAAADQMRFTGQRIAILRLDADLYESTKICLEYLYPLVSRGGCVVVDDFALAGCRKAVDEYLAYPPVYFQKEV
jgi:O-methyltransferase